MFILYATGNVSCSSVFQINFLIGLCSPNGMTHAAIETGVNLLTVYSTNLPPGFRNFAIAATASWGFVMCSATIRSVRTSNGSVA